MGDPSATSLRERKKRATRKAIHEAAFDLVEERGFSGVTIDAISARADVAPRTFWAYFSSKEDAVVDRDAGRPQALRAALLRRPVEEDVLTALREVLLADLEERAVDRTKALRRARLIRREPQLMHAVAVTFDEIERALVLAVAERLGAEAGKDLFPGVLVSAACGAGRVAFSHWSERRGGLSLRELLDEAFGHLGRGFAVQSAGVSG